MNAQKQKNRDSHHHTNGNAAELLIKITTYSLEFHFMLRIHFKNLWIISLLCSNVGPHPFSAGTVRTYWCTHSNGLGFLKVDDYNRSLQYQYCAWFEASAAVQTRSALLRDFTQSRMVVSCRRFGTVYRSRLPGSSSSLTIWPLKMGPIGCPETL